MKITYTSILSAICSSILLLDFLSVYIWKKQENYSLYEVKLLIFCTVLTGVRLFFPIDICGISHTIGIKMTLVWMLLFKKLLLFCHILTYYYARHFRSSTLIIYEKQASYDYRYSNIESRFRSGYLWHRFQSHSRCILEYVQRFRQ